MEYVRITNIIQTNGQANYKGLDLSKIVGGSQLYPSYANDAYFLYDGEVVEGDGIQIVTQATYDEHNTRIIQEQALIITPEKRLEILEQTLAEILGV